MKTMARIIVNITGNFVYDPVSKYMRREEEFIHTGFSDIMPKDGGMPIVLTASMIEMSDFNLNPFMAFSGGFILSEPIQWIGETVGHFVPILQ